MVYRWFWQSLDPAKFLLLLNDVTCHNAPLMFTGTKEAVLVFNGDAPTLPR